MCRAKENEVRPSQSTQSRWCVGITKATTQISRPLNVQETVMDVEGSALRQDKPGRTSYEVRSFSFILPYFIKQTPVRQRITFDVSELTISFAFSR